MIKVLHFDCKNIESLKQELEETFKLYQEVDYHYFKRPEGSLTFIQNQESIEDLLPKKDVFLVHPGIGGQPCVFNYLEEFPHLKIAFLVHDTINYYTHGKGKIKVFGYHNIQGIIDFVLSAEKK